ncbi:NAD-dependent epimerase/dehydratase family protein [Alkalilimnicola ehrlichii]
MLVLGGTGQIGAQVTRELHQRGAWVGVLCRSARSMEKRRL